MFDLIYGIPDQSFFDSYWAAIHFSSGFLTGLALIYLGHYKKQLLNPRRFSQVGLVLLICWEYFEILLRYADQYNEPLAQALERIIPESFFAVESVINISSDLVLGGIGLYLAYQLLYKKINQTPQR